jgi:pimeloyl-ACP methyl ester carboxylesterase
MIVTTPSGSTVSYMKAGEGPGLVFVAGTGLGALLNYGHLLDAFTPRRTVVLPDYAASGETPDVDGELTVDLLAEQIAAATEDAVDGPVDLVGYSLGAVVAAAIAATRPELVRRLVLVAGWPGPEDGRHQLAIDLWQRLERTDHDLLNLFLQLICFSPPFLSGLGVEGVRQLVAGAPPLTPGMRRHLEVDKVADVTLLLPKIIAPTLVVGLTRDQVVPVERVRELRDLIPGSEYAEIDSGHMAPFERPAELVAAIQGFLFAEDAATL